ncbi:ATP-dependent endonuclease [Bacillus sp. CGMCC 1.16607]|uniref:ATP-dependent nuclease n=1 Tax=Bacillus sp. CGMCC 1.16607 TaxID=3351842 RepID=UPI00363E563B
MLKIDLTNFKQYKNISFKLTNHNLIYGSNGSGKTTVIDSLTLFFSEQHNLYGTLINEADNPKDTINIFQHYISNRTSRHKSQHLSHFSHNKTAFEIKFHFLFNDDTYFVKKKYHHDGNISITCNFDIKQTSTPIIKEFFKYNFIYYKKTFVQSHLSKGELAIKFLSSSLYELSNIIKTSDPSKIIIAFDEPDNKIHPAALEPILNQILSQKVNSILTTTNLFTLEHYIKNKCSITLTHRTLENNKYISQTEQFLISDGNNDIVEKIYSSPTFSSILPYKKFLLVEGKSDKQFFEALIHDKLKLYEIEIISIDGQDQILSSEKLTPFLNLLRSMYKKNPLIYAIFDFDKDGIEYAKQFVQIIKKDHIYFINRKSYIDLINTYDESLNELEAKFNNKLISTFVLEDYLKSAFKKTKIKKSVKSSKVIKELKDSLSFKLKRLHMSDEMLKSFLTEFGEWIPTIIDIEKELYKNEQKNKFAPLFDSKKINEPNLKSSDYNSLKNGLSKYLVIIQISLILNQANAKKMSMRLKLCEN